MNPARPSADSATSSSHPLPGKRWDAELVSLVTVAAILAGTELLHPYYFLQDDNRVAVLGLLASVLRSFAGGSLAFFNWNQLLGIPMLEIGAGFAFYPPLHLAAGLSQLLFGHIQAALDILVIAHLLCGALATARLCRAWGLEPASGMVAGISWPLCSMAVFMSNSWLPASAVVAYLPWMLLFTSMLLRQPRGRVFAAILSTRAALFLMGHIQFFIYSMIFEVVFASVSALVHRAREGHRPPGTAAYGLSIWINFCLTLWLVLPYQLATAASVRRAGALTYGAFNQFAYSPLEWILSAVHPFVRDPYYYARPPLAWGARAMRHLAFAGWVTLAAPIAALALGLPKGALARRHWQPAPTATVACLVIALLWSWGALSPVLYFVPVLNRFRWPFRVNLFAELFLVLITAFALTWLLRTWHASPGRKRAAATLCVVIQLVSFAALYWLFPMRSFNARRHLERPPLVEPLAEVLGDERYMSLGYPAHAPLDSHLIGFDYASLFNVYAYGGYENLISRNRAERVVGLRNGDPMRVVHDGVFKGNDVPAEYFRSWGVRWYLVAKPEVAGPTVLAFDSFLASPELERIYEDENRLLYRDSAALPMVRWQEDGATARRDLDFETRGDRLRVDLGSVAKEATLLVAFLFDEAFEARIDDTPVELSSAPEGQILVPVPVGAKRLEIRYRSPGFATGLRLGSSLLAITTLVLWLWQRRRATGREALENG